MDVLLINAKHGLQIALNNFPTAPSNGLIMRSTNSESGFPLLLANPTSEALFQVYRSNQQQTWYIVYFNKET